MSGKPGERGELAEFGAALVLALLLVGVLACLALAALDVADESFREDRVAQTARIELYGAGGALEVLVTAMRADPTWGREGMSCAGLSTTADDGALVQASCTPLHGSGALVVGGLGARADRVVDLVATIAGNRVARERVEFVDGGGTSPGAVVHVRNWTSSS